jgi:GT2 family glycosyltransferase
MNIQSSNKKISFLIVTWNNADIIEECIDTLLAFSPYENEVIVVDNCSPDNTMQVIRDRYGDRVKLIDAGDNLGFAKANNLALQHATGEYICYTNPDVIFIEDILTPMVKVLDSQPEIGVVSPMLLYKDKSYQVSACNFPGAAKVFWDDLQMYRLLPESKRAKLAQAQYRKGGDRFVDWTYGALQLCRTEDVKAIGGYPDSYFMYGEDADFCMTVLRQLNKKTFYLGSSRIIHLGGYSESKVLNSRKPMVVTKTGLYFVKKYQSAANLLAYKYILFNAALMKHIIFSIKCLFSKAQKNLNGKTKWGTTWKTILTWRGELH